MTAGLPKLFWFFWWGSLVNRLGTVVVPYLMFYLTRELRFTATRAGVVVALFGLGSAVASLVGGALADRWGRRPTALLGLTGGPLVLLLVSQARTELTIGAGVFLFGLVSDVLRPAVSAAIADVVPSKDRGRAYGLQYWAVNLGFSVAAVSGGFLARLGYEALFLADALSMLAYGAIVYRFVPETRPVAASAVGAAGPAVTVTRDHLFVVFLGLCLALALVFMQANASWGADMAARGFDEADFGLVMALNGVLVVLLQPKATARMTRTRVDPDGVARAVIPPAHVMAVSALFTGLGFGVYALGTWSGYVAGTVIWTLGEVLMAPVNLAVVAALAPVAQRGRYQGAFAMVHGLASCAGPLVGGLALERLGPAGLWSGCAVLGAACGVGYLTLTAPLRRRLG